MPRMVRGQKAESVPNQAIGWKATRKPIVTAQLIDIGPGWLGWDTDKIDVGFLATLPIEKGIAKITPPAGLSEAVVYQLETILYERGARMVRIMPHESESKVQVATAQEQSPTRRSLRQVAIDRAMRVQSPRDQAALVDLVNSAMDQGEKP